MAKKKQEALTVNRLISEVLVSQLSIPLHQIVNDTSFEKYTGSKRPDLLISEFEYDLVKKNDDQFINNLVVLLNKSALRRLIVFIYKGFVGPFHIPQCFLIFRFQAQYFLPFNLGLLIGFLGVKDFSFFVVLID